MTVNETPPPATPAAVSVTDSGEATADCGGVANSGVINGGVKFEIIFNISTRVDTHSSWSHESLKNIVWPVPDDAISAGPGWTSPMDLPEVLPTAEDFAWAEQQGHAHGDGVRDDHREDPG